MHKVATIVQQKAFVGIVGIIGAILLAMAVQIAPAFAVGQGGVCARTSDCESGLTCQDTDAAANVETLRCEPRVRTGFGVKQVEEGVDLGRRHLIKKITAIINVLLGLLGIIAVVIILVGGFKWMTAGGNEDKVGEARKMIFAGIIGLAIILSAFAIAKFVIAQLASATESGNIEATQL